MGDKMSKGELPRILILVILALIIALVVILIIVFTKGKVSDFSDIAMKLIEGR